MNAVRYLAAAAVLLLCATGAQAEVRFVPTRCSVPADASFKILGARDHMEGIAVQYRWLARQRPGWQRESRALLNKNGRLFDVHNIRRGDRRQRICFEINDFWGKGFEQLRRQRPEPQRLGI